MGQLTVLIKHVNCQYPDGFTSDTANRCIGCIKQWPVLWAADMAIVQTALHISIDTYETYTVGVFLTVNQC